ncbi:MAG: hypothetical protein GEU87_07000 [Alphaproteobacteria bacterium]|nr:hypothetical protein [Alphaproteobacteria bacterium]
MTWRPRQTRRPPAGVLRRFGNCPHRRIVVSFLAFFFVSYMTVADSVGAIKAVGAAVTSHHDIADASTHHHEPCTAAEADPGCAESHGQSGHGHGDLSSTCCGFACHITLTAEARTLVSPLGRSETVNWIANSIRAIGTDPFERPPRNEALPLG